MPIPTLRKKESSSWQEYRASHNSGSQKKKIKRILNKNVLKKAGLALIALMIIGLLYAVWISRDLPSPNQLMNREIAQSTKIYDRTGEHVLYEISGDQKRTLVTLNEIPNYVKQATVAIEDKNFYKHGGFSLWSMFRTAVTNVLFNRSAGGSTLTQQFIKNAVLTPEKTLTRKIKELILSYRLEQKFSKDEILQMYLNEIPYGSNAYGVEAASQKYFGKDVKDVSLAEAAVLAAIVQTPSRYSPYGPNKDLLLSRKDYVLDLMAEQNYISTSERDQAKSEVIKFREQDNNITAPHFVMYVKDLLTEKYGEKMVEQGGLKIYTTLDLYKQQTAEEVITERTKDYPQKYGANNAALVAIDPKTGQILAMVGSKNYFDDSIDGQVNIATSPRQPGSSMKPLVYATLFGKGYTPDTILYDVVTNFSTDPANPYTPHDYDMKERGPVTIRQALAGSLNIPAVKAIYLAGVYNVIDLAENLGYSTLYPRDRFGLSLVLGGAEVKLLEHVNAYSAFARDGQISPIVSILKVEDKDGHVIEEYQPSEKKALDSKIVRMINSILTDNAARTYIFGAKNYLNLGSRPVAAKTGTTNNFHDAWTIGYTPSLVAGVWVGNSNNKAMATKADGSVVAAPIWHDFMAKVLGDTPFESFKAPDNYKTGKGILDGQVPTETINVDKTTGQLASSNTPLEQIEQRTAPVYHTILYYIDRNDPLGPAPTNSAQDPQFSGWEAAVLNWGKKHATSSPLTATSTSSTGDNNQKPENKPVVTIISPTANQTITAASLPVQIDSIAPRGISKTEYYINNNLWETKFGTPSAFTKDINFLNNGYQSLRVKSCDDSNNCGESSVNFNLLISNNPIGGGQNTIKMISPAENQTIKATNFPINIKVQVTHPERVAQINLVLKNTASGAIEIVKKTGTPNGKNSEISWGTAPVAGNYSLYAELEDWTGDTIKSDEVKITVSK